MNVSTSFLAQPRNNGPGFIDSLIEGGVSGVELDYRFTAEEFKAIETKLADSALKIVSIHNFFPVPDLSGTKRGDGDFYLLSSADPVERGRAVQATIKTMERAAKLGASVVVLHCGRIEIESRTSRLAEFFHRGQSDSLPARQYLEEYAATLERHKPPLPGESTDQPG